MKNKSNPNQVYPVPQLALDVHQSLPPSGQQAYMYINKPTQEEPEKDTVLSRHELINRISQFDAEDTVIELAELLKDVERVAHKKIRLATYNSQFDIIADEELMVEVLKYVFAQIPSAMKPELRFTVGFGMGSVQIQFNDDLTNHASALELVALFMKKERGYVWMVGKTLHLVFQVHNKLMAA